MALSEKVKEVIRIAMADKEKANELIAEIDKIAASGAIAPIASDDATDLATALTLANETKAQVNAIIAALA